MDERTRLPQLAPVEYYYLTEPPVKRTREGNGARRDWKGDLGAQVCTKTTGIECRAHFKQKQLQSGLQTRIGLGRDRGQSPCREAVVTCFSLNKSRESQCTSMLSSCFGG